MARLGRSLVTTPGHTGAGAEYPFWYPGTRGTATLAAKTRETRDDYAARKANARERRKLELAGGAARATGVFGVLRGIPRDARTLEAAMGIEAEVERVVEAAKSRQAGAPSENRQVGLTHP